MLGTLPGSLSIRLHGHSCCTGSSRDSPTISCLTPTHLNRPTTKPMRDAGPVDERNSGNRRSSSYQVQRSKEKDSAMLSIIPVDSPGCEALIPMRYQLSGPTSM